MIESSFGGKPPPGCSNTPKALEIARFMERGGFKDTDDAKRKFSELLMQARQMIQLPDISELDRVWMALKRGCLR